MVKKPVTAQPHTKNHISSKKRVKQMSRSDRYTEKDQTYCPFYRKTGACRHGTRCSRQHVVPLDATCVLLPHFWINPTQLLLDAQHNHTPPPEICTQKPAVLQTRFEDFFSEIHVEMRKYGVVEEMHVLDNLSDHLVGNVYIRFKERKMAEAMIVANRGRWFAGRCLMPEMSPIPNFAEGRCRKYDMNTCDRGGACNFLHIKKLGDSFGRDMQYQQDLTHYKHVKQRRIDEEDRRALASRSRSRSRSRSSRSRSRSRSSRSRSRSSSRSRSRSYSSYSQSSRSSSPSPAPQAGKQVVAETTTTATK